MSRKGEKRRWADCKSGSAQDGRRRSPRLTSAECNLQSDSNPTAPAPPTSSGKVSTSECKEGQKQEYDYHGERWLPEKHILELVLDTVQRKDSHDIFAEPVDPSEVEEYYEIISEPMDFGTMRAKLYEGLYTNLQQFERDMYLIFQNAMYFNSSGTVYFRQARALEDLANKVFHALKTHGPDNFEMEYSPSRRRSSRKLDDEHTPHSTFVSGQKFAKDLGSNTMNTDIDQKGSRRRKRPNTTSSIDRRCTYKPWKSVVDETNSAVSSVNCDNRPTIHVIQENYRKSLMSFVRGLGPTAERVAEGKLQGLRTQPTTSRRISDSSDCSTDLNNPFGRSLPTTNSECVHEKTGVSMVRPTEKAKLTYPSSHLQRDLDNPFYRSIPISNPRHILEKMGVSMIGPGPNPEKEKVPEKPISLNSKDAVNSSATANLGKCEPQLRDNTIVMGLVANPDRHHRKAPVSQCGPVKDSKQNQGRKFDLNQAQPSPSPSPSHASACFKEDGLPGVSTPFWSHAPAAAAAAAAVHNNMMAPLFYRQFRYNEPYMECSRINGIGITSSTTMFPTRFRHGLSTRWPPLSNSMSFGQGSSSRESTSQNDKVRRFDY